MIDIGCVYKGYGSDLTRTWVVGRPTEGQKKMAHHLLEVHEKILAVLKPGVMLGEVFDLRRMEMKNLGYVTESGYADPWERLRRRDDSRNWIRSDA